MFCFVLNFASHTTVFFVIGKYVLVNFDSKKQETVEDKIKYNPTYYNFFLKYA